MAHTFRLTHHAIKEGRDTGKKMHAFTLIAGIADRPYGAGSLFRLVFRSRVSDGSTSRCGQHGLGLKQPDGGPGLIT